MKSKQGLFLLCLIVSFCLLVQLHVGLAIVFSIFFGLLQANLWSQNLRTFLYLLLGFGMPILPDLGFVVATRILNWFDLIFIIFGAWGLLHYFGTKNSYRLDKVSCSSLVFLFVLLCLVFRSPLFVISLREWVSYLVNFFLTYWIIQSLDKKDLKPFMVAVLSASILVCIVALWQNLNGFRFPTVIDGEVSIRLGVPGTFSDSLILSMYAGFMTILSLMGVFRYQNMMRYFCIFCAFANLLSIKLALSRNGIFIVLMTTVIFMIFRFIDWSTTWRKAVRIPVILVSAPIIGAMSLNFMPMDIYNRITSAFYLFSGSNDPVIMYNIRSTLGRLENYKASVKIFLENPLEGIGLGLYPVFTKFHDTDGFYTGLLAETGLVGLVGFLIFALTTINFLRTCIVKFKSESGSLNTNNVVVFYEVYAALILSLFLVSFFEPVFKIQIMTFYIFYFIRSLAMESRIYELVR